MLDSRFSRERFAAQDDPQELIGALSAALSGRLRGAEDPEQCIAWIIAELRELGHRLYSLDSDPGEFQIWTDDWTERGRNRRTIVRFDLAPRAARKVTVQVVPVPQGGPELICPRCGGTMHGDRLGLDVRGHGSVIAPPVRVQIEIPGGETLGREVSAGWLTLQMPGFACSKCGGIWLTGQRSFHTNG
jgi:hypothetical protein